jgi:hypothetical protein
MAVSAPLVALLGIRGALLTAGPASIVAAFVASALRLHHLRSLPVPTPVPESSANPAGSAPIG